MSDDKRPEWRFKIPYALAKWLCENAICKIELNTDQVGVDATKTYLILHSHRSQRRVALDFFIDGDFMFSPMNGRSLVEPIKWLRIREKIKEIEAWEASQVKDRLEYERLKKKFEGKTQAPRDAAQREAQFDDGSWYAHD